MNEYKHEREYFDEMDEVDSPMGKVIGLAVLVHVIALIYVYLWQVILTI